MSCFSPQVQTDFGTDIRLNVIPCVWASLLLTFQRPEYSYRQRRQLSLICLQFFERSSHAFTACCFICSLFTLSRPTISYVKVLFFFFERSWLLRCDTTCNGCCIRWKQQQQHRQQNESSCHTNNVYDFNRWYWNSGVSHAAIAVVKTVCWKNAVIWGIRLCSPKTYTQRNSRTDTHVSELFLIIACTDCAQT